MNKTVNINLGGTFFHIDEFAYQKLKKYLDAVRRSLNDDPQGVKEIINDIETRISELLAEKVKDARQVVSDQDIDEIIDVMGQPEDYQLEEEVYADKRSYSSSKRKLYRDPDDKFIGGVAAGLAHYFDVDVVWIRVGWLVATFGLGFGFLAYIIMWIIVPEAKTTSEKLEMQGDEVNISNIEKKVRSDFEYATDSVKNAAQEVGDALKEGYENVTDALKKKDLKRHRSQARSGIQEFFHVIGSIITSFFMVFGKFIGVILIIASVASIVGLIISLFTASTFDFMGIHDLFDGRMQFSNITDIPMWTVSLILLFLVGIPMLALFFLGLSILSNKERLISRTTKFAMLGVWLISLFAAIFFTTKQAANFAREGTVIEKTELTFTPSDTLRVNMIFNEEFENNRRWHSRVFKTVLDGDTERNYSNNVRFGVDKSEDNTAYIKVQKSAHGRSITKAKEIADEITYKVELDNGYLHIDNYFLSSTKFRDQEVRVTLYLPNNYKVYLDANTNHYMTYTRNTNDMYRSSLANHYFEMTDQGLACLDCEVDKIEDDKEEKPTKEEKDKKESKEGQSTTNDTPKTPVLNQEETKDSIATQAPPQPKVETDTITK